MKHLQYLIWLVESELRCRIVVAFYFVYPLCSYVITLPDFLITTANTITTSYLIGLFIYHEMELSKIDMSDTYYSVKNASGYSDTSFITRLGGGRNCLKIDLTKEYLLLHTYFPFSLIAPVFDGVHIIKRQNIVSISKVKLFLFGKGYRIEFSNDIFRKNYAFTVFPNQPDLFEESFSKHLRA